MFRSSIVTPTDDELLLPRIADLQKDLADHNQVLAGLDDVLDAAESLFQKLGWIGVWGTDQTREGAGDGDVSRIKTTFFMPIRATPAGTWKFNQSPSLSDSGSSV